MWGIAIPAAGVGPPGCYQGASVTNYKLDSGHDVTVPVSVESSGVRWLVVE